MVQIPILFTLDYNCNILDGGIYIYEYKDKEMDNDNAYLLYAYLKVRLQTFL
jgi:hypothetical protein